MRVIRLPPKIQKTHNTPGRPHAEGLAINLVDPGEKMIQQDRVVGGAIASIVPRLTYILAPMELSKITAPGKFRAPWLWESGASRGMDPKMQ